MFAYVEMLHQSEPEVHMFFSAQLFMQEYGEFPGTSILPNLTGGLYKARSNLVCKVQYFSFPNLYLF